MEAITDIIRLVPLRGLDILLAVFATACTLYVIGRATVWLYALLFKPLDYRAEAAHLRQRAAWKRGRVTRNMPRSEAAAVQSQRHATYPNGWFFLDLSATFLRGRVRHVSILGLELAVFRDDKDDVHALDAYCPHLGANMAIGGQVIGDCLECPFHGWQFRGSDGKCQRVPGAKRVPEAASTRTWRVLERNGAVFLWHHAEDREPDWLLPELGDLASGAVDQMCGRTEHVVFSHIQDIPENAADMAHFDFVHKASSALGSDMRVLDAHWMSIWWHKLIATTPWRPLGNSNSHLAKTILRQTIVIGNLDLSFTNTEITVTMIGPGIVNLLIHNEVLGRDLLLCQYVVPEEPLKQRVTQVMYSQRGIVSRLYGKLVLSQETHMFERDIQIWNNKCFRPRPCFAASAGDEYLLKFRRWFSQFYSRIPGLEPGRDSPANFQCSLDWYLAES